MLKKISVIGILTCILYFISVGLFLITKADIALTIWELMTVISGPLVLLVMTGLIFRKLLLMMFRPLLKL